ncbi:MAG: glucosaminidase domain-containing protein [Alphaproteobacteria bacterium]
MTRGRAAAALLTITAAITLATPAHAVPTWIDEGTIGSLDQAPRPELKPKYIGWPERRQAPLVTPGGVDALDRLKADAGMVIKPVDADGLAQKFNGFGYRLATVRSGDAHVPRLYVDVMPRDMRALRSVDRRKRLFIRTMLPMILRANEEVRRERELLQRIVARQDAGQPVEPAALAFVARLKEIYADPETGTDELLRRVDTVPPSLALAQAAEESGWGTSRFVREGNAVFGQRTYAGTGGLVPQRRERNQKHLVRSFSHVQASVAAYVFNLNTHPAYDGFRAERARRRAADEALDSRRLVAELNRYSERGAAYIRTIRTIIRVNKLWQFDDARLAPQHPTGRDNNQLRSIRWSL